MLIIGFIVCQTFSILYLWYRIKRNKSTLADKEIVKQGLGTCLLPQAVLISSIKPDFEQ